MLNTNHLIANHAMELLPFLQNLGVGIIGLVVSLLINVFFLRRIAVYFEMNARIHLDTNRYNHVFVSYFTAIVYLMLVQVMCIIAWGGLMMLLGLIDHPFFAILFAGSCYTTIGIVSDTMPNAWKLQAIFIALSGLFAIALSTASMLGMGPLFRQAWYRKHDKGIRALMTKNHLEIPQLDTLEGKVPSEDHHK